MRTVLKHRLNLKPGRRGTVLLLLAVCLVILLGFTAFCIDIGSGALTQSALQNAADSAAAAGAVALQQGYSSYSIPSQNALSSTSSAEATATNWCVTYAGYNGATNVASLNLASSDVVFGFTNSNGVTSTSFSGYPNTVSVTIRRDGTSNPALSLSFAPIIGTSSLSLTASSSATIYTGLISSFNPNGGGVGTNFSPSVGSGSGSGSGNGNGNGNGNGSGNGSGSGSGSGGYGGWGSSYANAGSSFNCTLLPLAFDVNNWNQFMSTGQSPDGTIHLDSNSNPEIQVYPSPKNSPGNFGLLCIGAWTNATPDYENWILNGPSASDLQYLVNAGLYPVSQSSPQPWKGSPGLRSVLSSYFQQIIGEPRLLPVFQPASQSPYQAASGSGQNTTYAIVGFVGVTVCSVSGSGSNLNISVKPCDVIDPTAVFDSSTVYPVGAQPASQLNSFTHPSLKFTK